MLRTLTPVPLWETRSRACACNLRICRNMGGRDGLQEIKAKLIEIVAEDETYSHENVENYLTFAGSSVLADALIKLAGQERLCCYALKGQTLVKKVEPENKDTHATTLVFNEWGGRI